MKLGFVPIRLVAVHSLTDLRLLAASRAPLQHRLYLFDEEDEDRTFLLFRRAAFRALLNQLERAGPWYLRENELLERTSRMAHLELSAEPVGAPPSKPAVAASGGELRGLWLPEPLAAETRAPARTVASGLEQRTSRRRRRPTKPARTWQLRRTPHLQPPRSVRPGATFRVRVWCDDAPPAAEEQVDEIDLTFPEGIEQVPLDVWLTGYEHFDVQAPAVRSFDIIRDEPRSPTLVFEVRVVEDPPAVDDEPRLTAVFSYEGRPAGSVTRPVNIAERPRTGPRRGEPQGGLECGPMEPADLYVTVLGSERGFSCKVESPVLEDFRRPQVDHFSLPDRAAVFVADTLETVAGGDEMITDPEERLAELRGAGTVFWEVAPGAFQEAIWQLAKLPPREDGGPRRIFIVTQEPALPWELMIPERQHGDYWEELPPVGVAFTVGRWIHPKVKPAPQSVEITRGHILVPTYRDLEALDSADEIELIESEFDAVSVKPVSFKNLNEELGRGPVSLLHFIGHGETANDRDTIYIDRDHPLTSQRLLGMRGVKAGCRAGKPLVFLNACEVGRPIGGLTGAGGFARSFAQLGATAVIAPLWSVANDVATSVAIEVYREALARPRRPFAEIVRAIRQRGYQDDDWEDTYAAYCFYGDPAATLV